MSRHSKQTKDKIEALLNKGVPYPEIARQCGIVNRVAVAGIVHRIRHKLYRPDRTYGMKKNPDRVNVGSWVDRPIKDKLTEMGKDWNCSMSEVVRTLLITGIEEYEDDV